VTVVKKNGLFNEDEHPGRGPVSFSWYSNLARTVTAELANKDVATSQRIGARMGQH
jgi:hypothetical protein